ARFQGELAGDQIELVLLGPFEGAPRGRGGPVGAGVHHRRAEDDLVEVVADVVVVADGASVAVPGVQAAAGAAGLLGRRGGRQREARERDEAAYGGAEGGVAQRLGEGAGLLVALPEETGEPVEEGVEVALDGE